MHPVPSPRMRIRTVSGTWHARSALFEPWTAIDDTSLEISEVPLRIFQVICYGWDLGEVVTEERVVTVG